MCLGTGMRALEWHGVVEEDGTVHLIGNGHRCTGKVAFMPTRGASGAKDRVRAAICEQQQSSSVYLDGTFDVVFANRSKTDIERDLKSVGKRMTSKALLHAQEEDAARRGQHYCKMAFRSTNTIDANKLIA